MNRLGILAAACMFAGISPAHGAEQADMDKLIGHMLLKPSKTSSVEKYTAWGGMVETIFTWAGKRYILAYASGKEGDGPGLVVVIGTVDNKANETDAMMDLGPDGIVDVGFAGVGAGLNRVGPQPEHKKYVATDVACSHDQMLCGPLGTEFSVYWQGRFDEAIKDALAFYEKN